MSVTKIKLVACSSHWTSPSWTGVWAKSRRLVLGGVVISCPAVELEIRGDEQKNTESEK
jgi:hypothetical protein